MTLLQAINIKTSCLPLNTFIATKFMAITLLVYASSKNNFEDTNLSSDRRSCTGLEMKNSWTYDFEKILYLGANNYTFRGFEEYELHKNSTVKDGDTAHQIIQYCRPNHIASYILSRADKIRFKNNRYIISQGGLNYLKLVLPLNENKSLLVNILFDTSINIMENIGNDTKTIKEKGSEWRYLVDYMNYSKQMGELYINNVFGINLVEYLKSLAERLVNEEYAENIGLISNHMVVLNRPTKTDLPLFQDAIKVFTLQTILKSLIK
jgi:hypothetical protein